MCLITGARVAPKLFGIPRSIWLLRVVPTVRPPPKHRGIRNVVCCAAEHIYFRARVLRHFALRICDPSLSYRARSERRRRRRRLEPSPGSRPSPRHLRSADMSSSTLCRATVSSWYPVTPNLTRCVLPVLDVQHVPKNFRSLLLNAAKVGKQTLEASTFHFLESRRKEYMERFRVRPYETEFSHSDA